MPGPHTFLVPPHVAAKFGLSMERLCARAGVPLADAWNTDDYFRLWAAAEDALDDPAAGLRFGSQAIAGGYGVASLVALHAPDLRQALAALARYKRLTCPELVEVEVQGDEARVRYRWLQASERVPRLLVDTTLAALRELVRAGTAGRVVPLRVELARPAAETERFGAHFACPLVFDAADDAMVFARPALDVPMVTADGGAFARVLKGLEERVVEGEGLPLLVGQLRVAIARQLSEGRPPTMHAVAARLGLGSRTLQRRLTDIRTSFQQQLAAVRRTTAGRLLANTALDPVAIALMLGFSEPNSFARAFRHWERTTPMRWRERHAGAIA